MVLKRNVDYDQAMKYQTALQRAGAVCDVKEVIQDIDQQAAAPSAPPPIQPQSGVHMVGGEIQAAHETESQAQTKKKAVPGWAISFHRKDFMI